MRWPGWWHRFTSSVEWVPHHDAAAWPRDALDAYLKLPHWRARCACGEYGNPWQDGQLQVITDDTRHEPERCQPMRETL